MRVVVLIVRRDHPLRGKDEVDYHMGVTFKYLSVGDSISVPFDKLIVSQNDFDVTPHVLEWFNHIMKLRKES